MTLKDGTVTPTDDNSVGYVLVGASGAGKSTIGPLLAEQLGVPFVDVDTEIEIEAGKPIRDIFATDGEPAFRALEVRTTLDRIRRPGVISLGGGAVLSSEIRAALKDHRVVWLQVSAAQAVQRIGLNEARPLLLGNVRGQLIRMIKERMPLYAEVATLTVNTDDRDPATVVAEIVQESAGYEGDSR